MSPAAVRRVQDGPPSATSTPKIHNTSTIISSSEADLMPETPKSTEAKKPKRGARKSISVVSPAVNVSFFKKFHMNLLKFLFADGD